MGMISNKAFTFDEIKQKLVDYCVYQDRCHSEVEQKMKDYLLIPEAKEEIFLFLIQHNYLNEERFAKSFARGKFYMKQWGKKKIKVALLQKGIQEKLIQKAFSEIDEKDYLETIKKIIQKNISKYKGLKEYQKKQKITQYLMSKGFEYDLIVKSIDIDE